MTSLPDLEDRDSVLDEAIAAAESLGPLLRRTQRVRSASAPDAADLLRSLKEEKAGFGPRPEVLPLTAEALAARGTAVDGRVTALLERFDFFAVTLPVTLFPRRGWSFDRLECRLELNPGETAERRPIAHDIYPASEWETLAKANMKLEVGITEGLEFKAKSPGLVILGAEAAARLDAGAGFVFPPRDYCIKRAKVLSRGREDCEVFWRLDGDSFFEADEPRLGVVLKVPKGVTQVRAVGILAAYRSFNTLSADLADLVGYLGQRVKTFFEKGAPLVDRREWELGA